MSSRHALAGLLCAALLALLGAAVAQDVQESLREQLEAVPLEQRDRIYRRAAKRSAMSPEQKAQFDRRVADWHALPADERRTRRERWQAWTSLPSDQRARLRGAAAAFAALDVQQQLEARERYDALDEHQRRGWLLGPELGADWEALQGLLMHVPTDQREPLLEALRGMSRQQRDDLGVLAQRTPPQERDALRKGLLATPAARRGPWLVEQLER